MEDDARRFERHLERLARQRIGQTGTLDYRLSPYHGQRGRIVECTRMHDGAVVFTVEWPDGARLSYAGNRLTPVVDV